MYLLTRGMLLYGFSLKMLQTRVDSPQNVDSSREILKDLEVVIGPITLSEEVNLVRSLTLLRVQQSCCGKKGISYDEESLLPERQ